MGFITPRSLHEQMCRWLEEHVISQQAEKTEIILSKTACTNLTILGFMEPNFSVGDGFVYTGYEPAECDLITPFITYMEGRPEQRAGALRFHFAPADENSGEDGFDVFLISAWVDDESVNSSMLVFAAVPENHQGHWLAFQKECSRIASSAIPYQGKVYIVGGTETTFDATTEWDDIYLPQTLKDGILRDVDSFFQKGVAIYQRLNINPFRKLLFAGVPGTGKTMLCSAIAKWARARDYFVVYVSGSNRYGAQFWKIHQALDMAASSDAPTVVIVEELDAYLDDDTKAQLLNVLDGSETPMNQKGTLLIATTNHPEAIDDRVMKRPGRLDRIFIIPEMENEEDAEKMLMKYLGDDWNDQHREIIPDLIGRPGAFIREMALQALTLAAYQDEDGLPLDILQQSYDSLLDQIEAKEGFLESHKKRPMGLGSDRFNGRRRGRYTVREDD